MTQKTPVLTTGGMKLIYLEWVDSTAPAQSGWLTESEIDEFADGDFKILDLGFVYKETDEYVLLVGGCSKEEDGFERLYHRGIKIPKCAIIKRVDMSRHIKK